QDNYYLDYGGVEPGTPLPNFDHPDAFEWDFLRAQLGELKSGNPVHIPTYDFKTHRRTDVTILVEPKPIIILEGILILTQRALHSVFDQSFFVQCDEDVRLERRLKRDVAERGRTPASVREQFARDVAPMHDEFVEPSRNFADWIITQNQCSLEMIMNDGPVITWCRHNMDA
ncbi:MAG TPA: uridine kinase, partial [Hellea balneolensis]|nr:uridine kinase [Hellea balneolensis]